MLCYPLLQKLADYGAAVEALLLADGLELVFEVVGQAETHIIVVFFECMIIHFGFPLLSTSTLSFVYIRSSSFLWQVTLLVAVACIFLFVILILFHKPLCDELAQQLAAVDGLAPAGGFELLFELVGYAQLHVSVLLFEGVVVHFLSLVSVVVGSAALCANLSHSLTNTVSISSPKALSNPFLIQPIPANRSIDLNM